MSVVPLVGELGSSRSAVIMQGLYGPTRHQFSGRALFKAHKAARADKHCWGTDMLWPLQSGRWRNRRLNRYIGLLTQAVWHSGMLNDLRTQRGASVGPNGPTQIRL